MQRLSNSSSSAGSTFHFQSHAQPWRALLLLIASLAWFTPLPALAGEAKAQQHTLSGGKIKKATIVKGTFTSTGKAKLDGPIAGKRLSSGTVESAVIMQGAIGRVGASGVSVTHARLSNAKITNATVSGVPGTLTEAELTDATVDVSNAQFSGYEIAPRPTPCDDLKDIDLSSENIAGDVVTHLTITIDSCIRAFPSMTQVEIARARAKMKDQRTKVRAAYKEKGLSGEQVANLRNAEDELDDGLKAFDKLVDGWQDTFESYFYIGYSGTTVDNVKNQGTTLVGLYLYNQYNSLVRECPPDRLEPGTCGFNWRIAPHMYGNIFQSGSAEASNVTPATAGGTTPSQAQVVPSMEVNVGIFWPLYTRRQQTFGTRPGVLAVGPIAEHGWKMNSSVPYTIGRIYKGVRMAFSQNAHFDLMLGRTTGRKGRRVELRGQMPIYELSIGQVYLGGALNYDWKGVEPNTDSREIYVLYRVAFDQVFTPKNGAEK